MPDDRYIHGHDEPVLRSQLWRTAANSAAYLLPHLVSGLSLLDVGSGPGNVTRELARIVAPGRVVGIDRDPGVVALAAAAVAVDDAAEPTPTAPTPGLLSPDPAAPALPTNLLPPDPTGDPAANLLSPGLPIDSAASFHAPDSSVAPGTNRVHPDPSTQAGAPTPAPAAGEDAAPPPTAHQVTFEVADVYELPYDDDEFDIVHAHQLLQHLSDPVAALTEMSRVARPGGLVAVRDADYGAWAWYPPSLGLDRWREIYRAVARAAGAEPDAGRHLLAWAHAAGFTDVTPSTSTWCFATRAEREWWGNMWAQRAAETDFARQALALGLTDEAELAYLAEAWQNWAADDDGWIVIVHGEVLIRVPEAPRRGGVGPSLDLWARRSDELTGVGAGPGGLGGRPSGGASPLLCEDGSAAE
ncbi:MAG: methyltransferase domain-containing protein [Bifidobacteriaceae bacterium]|jgi:ubiquinone/menaquinone biosynthesis C-methylase UbiE|nr:methyltransferase domain-containing protein [Bifidobacteriaceae bacterium]